MELHGDSREFDGTIGNYGELQRATGELHGQMGRLGLRHAAFGRHITKPVGKQSTIDLINPKLAGTKLASDVRQRENLVTSCVPPRAVMAWRLEQVVEISAQQNEDGIRTYNHRSQRNISEKQGPHLDTADRM